MTLTAESTFAGTLPAITRTSDHTYYATLPDGRKVGPVPGVTNILKAIDKSDALIHWASAETADAAAALHDNGWSELERLVGPTGVKKALMERRNWKRDEAAHLGSAVHDLADQYVKTNVMPELTDSTRARVENYAEWWKNSGWRLRISEFTMFNATSEYGGTGDLLAYDQDNRTVLADLKTGAKGIYREAILQLTGYTDAEWISAMGSPTMYPMPKVDRHVLLWVTEAGVREIEVNIGEAERVAWYATIALYRWMQATKGKLT